MKIQFSTYLIQRIIINDLSKRTYPRHYGVTLINIEFSEQNTCTPFICSDSCDAYKNILTHFMSIESRIRPNWVIKLILN